MVMFQANCQLLGHILMQFFGLRSISSTDVEKRGYRLYQVLMQDSNCNINPNAATCETGGVVHRDMQSLVAGCHQSVEIT